MNPDGRWFFPDGYNAQFDPQNPDALFSPDQWLNQFGNFNNAALPWPSFHAGTPTDAMGRPIQPPPGMTLNSAPPAAPRPAAPAAPPQVPQYFLITPAGRVRAARQAARTQWDLAVQREARMCQGNG